MGPGARRRSCRVVVAFRGRHRSRGRRVRDGDLAPQGRRRRLGLLLLRLPGSDGLADLRQLRVEGGVLRAGRRRRRLRLLPSRVVVLLRRRRDGDGRRGHDRDLAPDGRLERDAPPRGFLVRRRGRLARRLRDRRVREGAPAQGRGRRARRRRGPAGGRVHDAQEPLARDRRSHRLVGARGAAPAEDEGRDHQSEAAPRRAVQALAPDQPPEVQGEALEHLVVEAREPRQQGVERLGAGGRINIGRGRNHRGPLLEGYEWRTRSQ